MVADAGRIHAQHARPRGEATLVPYGRGRQRHGFLGDQVDATVRDGVEDAPALRGRQVAAATAVADGDRRQFAEGRREHQFVETLEQGGAQLGVAQPPGGDVGDREFLAGQGLGQRRHEGEHRSRLDEAGAERIGDGEAAVAHCLDEARHAEPGAHVEFERIGEIAVEAAQQHVDAFEARNGADEDAVLAHAQVLALDQKEAEIAGQIRVLEIGLVHRPGREQGDAALVVAVESGEIRLQILKERCQAGDPQGTVHVRKRSRQRDPVLQRIAEPRRRLRAVGEHPPTSVGAAAEIGRIDAQMRATLRRDAGERAQEFRITRDDRGGYTAVAHQRAVPIGIAENRLQEAGALDQSLAQQAPFGGVEDHRHVAQGPRPLGVGRILVDTIEDARVAQVAVGGGEAAGDLVAAEAGQRTHHGPPVGPQPAFGIDHLVMNARQRAVAGEQRRDGVVLIVRHHIGDRWHADQAPLLPLPIWGEGRGEGAAISRWAVTPSPQPSPLRGEGAG